MTTETNLTYDFRAEASSRCDEDVEEGIMLELGSIGAGHAATALSQVLGQPIMIEVPRILNLPPHLIPKMFGKHEMETIAVYMQLQETYGCDILLAFELNEARKTAAMMTCAPSVEELDPEMEKSAIHELANILIGSFLTSISDFIGLALMPTTPESVADNFDAILDTFLIKQSLTQQNTMLFETRFKRDDGDSKCMLMIFPSQDLKQLMTEKSKLML